MLANSEDPDQTPRSTVSDLGLHCLPMYQKGLCGLIRYVRFSLNYVSSSFRYVVLSFYYVNLSFLYVRIPLCYANLSFRNVDLSFCYVN